MEENPLKQSIQQRMEEERYVFPREKERSSFVTVQLLIVLSILFGLLVTVLHFLLRN